LYGKPIYPVRANRYFLFLISLLLVTVMVHSQPSQRRHGLKQELWFQHFTTMDGLAQSAVFCIIQDQKGFIWAGTQQGLNRFDGYDFETFRFEINNPNSLSNNYVLCLLEDTAGIIWIGANGGGLNRFDPVTRRFSYYLVNEQSLDSPANIIRCILEDPPGQLWIGTGGGGLKSFNRQTGTFTGIRITPDQGDNPGQHNINAIYRDRFGALWLGTDGGLKRYNVQTGRADNYLLDVSEQTGPRAHRVLTIYEDRAGEPWFGTGHGFYRLNRADGQLIHFHVPVPGTHFSAANTIRAMYEDRFGVFWIGTDHGLHIFERRDHTFQSFFPDRHNPHSLNNNSVRSIFEDRSGALWLGTYGGGLDKLNRTAQSFKHYYSNPRDPDKISSHDVFALYEDKMGRLWIGTFGDGLNVYNRETGELKNYRNIPGDPASLSDNKIWSIIEDRQGQVWIGTSEGGVNRFSRETGQFTRFRYQPQNPSSLSNDTISCIIEDRHGAVWIASNGGINKFNAQTGTFTRYQTKADNADSLAHNVVYVLMEDRDGLIWAGTRGGLSILDPKTGAFTSYPIDPFNPGGMIFHPVFSFCQDQRGIMWIGTTGGVVRFIPKTKQFVLLGEKDGLTSDVINGILEDNRGNLWFSTNKGLSRYNPGTGKFNNYSQQDGLQSFEFNGGAYYKSRRGELFFGGINGFNAFFSEDVKDNPFIPPVVISGFKVFNRGVPVGKEVKGRVILNKSITDSEEIVLSHKHYTFSFQFAALNYIHSENNEYAYMMQGLEENWSYAGQRRFVTYANLAPGHYTFRVKASNNNGVWNEEGVSLKIEVLPPFFSTWWFRISVLALAALLIFGYHLLRNRLIHRRKHELEDIVASRTLALRESGEKYRAVVETAQQGIAIIQDRLIVFHNAQFAYMLGCDEKEMSHRQLAGFVVPSKQPEFKDLLERLQHEKQAMGRTETVFRHCGGQDVHMEISYGAIRYKRRAALLMFFQDIGMKKLLEAERMKSARLESSRTLARGIAHDFNNLLAIIIGYLGLAIEEVQPGCDLYASLKEAGKTSRRAADLTRQFIFLAKGGDPVKEVQDISCLVRESVTSTLHRTKVNCVFQIDENLWPADCDRDHVVQAIKNITTNARQAMPDGGILKVKAVNKVLSAAQIPGKKPGKYICITFKDNGRGIAEQDMPHIFDPYFSTRDDVTQKGLGLGLAVVHSIIQQHDGLIQVESQLGQGTLVRLCLPASVLK
jgi:PAS domain S-box-containing protein